MPNPASELRGPVRRAPPSPSSGPVPRTVGRPEVSGGNGPWLRCRACGGRVTPESGRVAVGGGHVHRRTNPLGVEFEFGCFDGAPGAVAVGRPTAEHTWFAGHEWSVTLCRSCAEHLGWFFQGGGSTFFGLILARLVPDGPAPGSPPEA